MRNETTPEYVPSALGSVIDDLLLLNAPYGENYVFHQRQNEQ
jgi:hypothetical protein